MPHVLLVTLDEVIVIVFTLFDHVVPTNIFEDPEGLPLTLSLKSNSGEIPEFIEIVP